MIKVRCTHTPAVSLSRNVAEGVWADGIGMQINPLVLEMRAAA